MINIFRSRAQRENIYSRPEFWNNKARDYEGSAVSMWSNRALNGLYEREQFEFVSAHLPNPEGLCILDVGCGTGRLSRHLAAKGARVTAFDFSEAAIAIAERESKSQPSEITYRVQSVFELADENLYDCAVAIGNLTIACKTTAELNDALSRIHRSLKSGGRLLLIESIHRGLLHRVLDLGVPEFTQVMEDRGFRLTALAPLHFWPTRLPLSYLNWPRPITLAGYHLGQSLMRLAGNRLGLGDYKGLAAVKLIQAC